MYCCYCTGVVTLNRFKHTENNQNRYLWIANLSYPKTRIGRIEKHLLNKNAESTVSAVIHCMQQIRSGGKKGKKTYPDTTQGSAC